MTTTFFNRQVSIANQRITVCLALFAFSILGLVSAVHAQDQTVNGNMGVSGILDVNGDTFNLGTWSSGSANYGFNVGYGEDANHAATLTLTATRPSATWISQQAASSGTGSLPKMKLSTGNALTLYDQASTPNATIVLDPLGTSSFGTSTTFLGMDNEMPHQTYMGGATVFTVGLADARYSVVNSGSTLTMGPNASASGDGVVAIGSQANATSGNSTAMGRSSNASNYWATAC